MEKRCIFCMEETVNEQGICTSCGRSQWEYVWNRRHLAPYTTLQGKYVLGAVLGAGGFGVTYVGFDTILAHRIAVKEFFPRNLAERESDGLTVSAVPSASELFEEQKQNFRTEALLLSSSLDTPGICNVIDYFGENNTAYIVEEYLSGQTLGQYLSGQPGGRIPWDLCLELFAPVLTGLCHIHSLGIIHCDISPDNLMFDADNSLKLVDFGAARQIAPADNGQKTKSDSESISDPANHKAFKETYAAPEQYADSRRIGPWTDLYAVCAVLFLVLTGEKPTSSLVRIKRQKPLSISAYTTVSQEVESAILQGMNLDIQRRYFYAGILMDRLGMDTDGVKPLTGRFRNKWGDIWLEIFTEGSFLSEKTGLFSRIRRWFTRDRLKRLLIGTTGAAGICFALGLVFFVYAKTHPEQVLRFRAKQQQNQAEQAWQQYASNRQTSSVQPDTKRYAKILELLSGYEHQYQEDIKTTIYSVPSSFLIRQGLISEKYHVFPLKLALAEQLIGYYLGQTLTAYSTDGLCTVSVPPDKPLDVYGFVENNYSYHTAYNTFATINISYDAATSRVGGIQVKGYQEDISLFLREIFPYFVPETYLTDDEITGLFQKMRSDPDNSACIFNHARFSLYLNPDSFDDELIWMSLDSHDSVQSIF